MNLPNGSSNLSMLSDDISLEDALKYPLDEWRLFLHPEQKKAVTYPTSNHLLVMGGPGTGKSIVLLHRCKWLLDNDMGPVVLLSNNKTLVQWLQMQYEKLDTDSRPQQVFFATSQALGGWCLHSGLELRKSGKVHGRRAIKILSSAGVASSKPLSIGSLLIDEGQDLQKQQLDFLLDYLRDLQSTHLTIAIDPLQAIESARGLAIKDVFGKFSSVNLSYSYRLSRSNGLFASAYALQTKSEIAHFLTEIGQQSTGSASVSGVKALNYYLGVKPITPSFGFDGPHPNIQLVNGTDMQNIESAISAHVQRWKNIYPQGTFAIIWVGDGDSEVFRRLSESKEYGWMVKSIHEVKGLEFYAGVVVGFEDGLKAYTETYGNSEKGQSDLLKMTTNVLSLNRLYVALTRFRNELVLLGTQKDDASMAFLRELVAGQLS